MIATQQIHASQQHLLCQTYFTCPSAAAVQENDGQLKFNLASIAQLAWKEYQKIGNDMAWNKHIRKFDKRQVQNKWTRKVAEVLWLTWTVSTWQERARFKRS